MLALILALATAFPSASKTAWMRPESFHLVINMPRDDAEKALRDGGWKTKKGADRDHLIVDYDTTRSLLLEFKEDRLKSVRFDLFDFIPDARKAFEEEQTYLRHSFGEPRKVLAKTVVIYDDRLPNVMVVLSDKPTTENGKSGLGFVTVRYYDPR